MWEKPYVSLFVEIGALRKLTHFVGPCSHYGGHFGSYFQYGRQNT
jgi:hypothetical protein